MKKIFSSLTILFLLAMYCSAQDIHQSLFTQSPLTVNPAMAGTTAWIRGLMSYRTQWRGVPVPYTTVSASFDEKIKKHWKQITPKTRTLLFKPNTEEGIGWGLNFYNDRAGDGQMNSMQVNGSLAYQVLMSREDMFAGGMQVGFFQRSINYSGLNWESQYDINQANGFNTGASSMENFSSHSFIRPDVGAGLLYSHKKNERYMRGNDQRDIQLGASILHLNKPKYSFFGTDERLDTRMMIHGNALIGISNTNISLVPSVLYAKQGPNKELLVGSLVRYMLKEDSKYTGYVKGATIGIGGFYRNKDAFVAAAFVEIASYAIGVSYDINISKLKAATSGRGGLEITLRFLNPAPFLYTQASFH